MENNSALPKNPESTYVIKFQDCDPLGHLNNVRYLDLFLNAREEHTMQHYALNLQDLRRKENLAAVRIFHFRAAWETAHINVARLR